MNTEELPPTPASQRYKSYLLGLLLVILASNYIDRVAVGLLLQDIKLELQLTDTQLGLLTGIAFAFFYSVMGIPIARWADRGNRVVIISLTAAIWSVMVALCGSARSFGQLLVIRIGVAVGEAGGIPPAQSLIADYFNRAERPRAIAIYMLGAPLAYGVGYFLAGWLNARYGWRMTFVLLGLPGVALAALASLTLREPRRTISLTTEHPGAPGAPGASSASGASSAPSAPSAPSAFGAAAASNGPGPPPNATGSLNVAGAANVPGARSPTAAPSIREVCATLWANVTFRHMLICYSVASLFGYGLWQWKPAFFIRSYGMETAQVGTWFSIIYGVCGLAGMYWGGVLAERRAAHNERLQLNAMAIGFAFFGVVSAGIYLSPNPVLALALMGLATFGYYMTVGPLLAMIQTLVLPRMRAVALATLYLFANLIGMGLGPLLVGALSDAMQPSLGQESLRYSLLALCPGYVWAALHLWRAAHTVERDLPKPPGADS